MGDPASSYATAGIALRILEVFKPLTRIYQSVVKVEMSLTGPVVLTILVN
jgi:hypothetical protein